MKCLEFIRYLLQLCILFVNQLYLLRASYLQIHLKVKYLSIFMPVLQYSRTQIFTKMISLSSICKNLWCVSLTQLFGLEIRLLNCIIHDLSFTGLEWIDTLNSPLFNPYKAFGQAVVQQPQSALLPTAETSSSSS